MLTLTDNASDVIKALTDERDLPADGGLRITQDPGSDSLAVTAAAAPEPGDEVIDDRGARVFLETAAASTLDDKVLDAHVDPNGAVEFVIAQQDM